MNLQPLLDELMKEIDIHVTNYDHYCKELQEISKRVGLDQKKEQLYTNIIYVLQELVLAEKLVRYRHPLLSPMLDSIIKLNKERTDKIVNFINQKLEITTYKEDN